MCCGDHQQKMIENIPGTWTKQKKFIFQIEIDNNTFIISPFSFARFFFLSFFFNLVRRYSPISRRVIRYATMIAQSNNIKDNVFFQLKSTIAILKMNWIQWRTVAWIELKLWKMKFCLGGFTWIDLIDLTGSIVAVAGIFAPLESYHNAVNTVMPLQERLECLENTKVFIFTVNWWKLNFFSFCFSFWTLTDSKEVTTIWQEGHRLRSPIVGFVFFFRKKNTFFVSK